jgi:hypothetical protein
VAAADHVVSHAWKISYTSATNEHDGVLLEVVAFAADVGGNFLAVGQANSSNLTKCRVWLLWRHRSYLKAYATLLGAGVEVTYVRLGLWAASWVADKLIDRGHWDSISAAKASRAVYQDRAQKWRQYRQVARRQPEHCKLGPVIEVIGSRCSLGWPNLRNLPGLLVISDLGRPR